MIIDKAENLLQYKEEYPVFEQILELIEKHKQEKISPGTYHIDGEKLFASIAQYRTEADKEVKFEAHRKYADLQYIVNGMEKIGWVPLGDVEDNLISEEYSKGGDIAFYSGKSKFDFVLTKGSFLFLLPEDAHAPCLCADKECNVEKIVFKIQL